MGEATIALAMEAIMTPVAEFARGLHLSTWRSPTTSSLRRAWLLWVNCENICFEDFNKCCISTSGTIRNIVDEVNKFVIRNTKLTPRVYPDRILSYFRNVPPHHHDNK